MGSPKPILDRYLPLRRLAEGGMGAVLLARDLRAPRGNRLVILKTLLPSLIDDPALVEGFLDEARVASALDHPNVVSILDVGEWEGTWYIAMEYIAGADLVALIRAVVRRKALVPWPIAATVIRDAALGLDHAHHACDAEGRPLRIVHRDISPGNIMVGLDGVTKVVDFGIASAANRVSHTQFGQLKGKLAYMAPEQLLQETLDGRCDQFSLGIVFWELCAGRRLFRAATDLEMTRNVLGAPVPLLSAVQRSVPPDLDGVAERMLLRARDHRFATCGEVAAAIDACLQRLGAAPPVDRWVSTLVVHPAEAGAPAEWPAAAPGPFDEVETLVLPRQPAVVAGEPEGEDIDLSDLDEAGQGNVDATSPGFDPWDIPTSPPTGMRVPADEPTVADDPWNIARSPMEGVPVPQGVGPRRDDDDE